MTDLKVRIVGGESSWNRCVKDLLGEVQFIVCDGSGRNVLATETEKAHRLPGWFSDCAFYRNMDYMKAAFEDVFGSLYKFTVLQCIWNRDKCFKRDDEYHVLQRSVVALECQGDMKQIPEGFRWVSITDARIIHSEEEAVQAIKRELCFLSRGESEFRVPWSRMAWHSEVTRWMHEELSSLGFVTSKSLVQLRAWPWGTVLRGNAGKEYFYLKASPCFLNEGAITSVLSEVAPGLVRKPLVVDMERRMFISSDYGETPKDISSSVTDLVQLMKDLARLQKASVQKVDELGEAGVPIYRPGWAAEHLDDLFDHEELSFMEDMSVRQGLNDKREIIRAALQKLDELTDGLPMTLIHGDLREDNIYRRADGSGGFGFFDWDCACIGLPLIDIEFWHDRKEVTEPYLEEWSKYQSMDNLREALRLSRDIFYVFQCYRAIYDLQHMEECCKQYCREHLFQVLGTLSSTARFLSRDFPYLTQ